MLLVGPGETVLSWALSLQPVIRPLPSPGFSVKWSEVKGFVGHVP